MLQSDVSAHQKNYNYVRETCQHLVDKATARPDVDKLHSQLDSLQRWNALVDAVNGRVDQCRSTIEHLKQYRVS